MQARALVLYLTVTRVRLARWKRLCERMTAPIFPEQGFAFRVVGVVLVDVLPVEVVLEGVGD